MKVKIGDRICSLEENKFGTVSGFGSFLSGDSYLRVRWDNGWEMSYTPYGVQASCLVLKDTTNFKLPSKVLLVKK